MTKFITTTIIALISVSAWAGTDYFSRYSLPALADNEISITEETNKALTFNLNADKSFLGLSLKAGDEVRLLDGTLYSVQISGNTSFEGILAQPDSKYKVVFHPNNNKIAALTLANDTNIQGYIWPAGSRVSFADPSQCASGHCVRSVILGGSLLIDGKTAIAGQKVHFHPRTGKPRIIK